MSVTTAPTARATWQGYVPEPPPDWEERTLTRTVFYREFIEAD